MYFQMRLVHGMVLLCIYFHVNTEPVRPGALVEKRGELMVISKVVRIEMPFKTLEDVPITLKESKEGMHNISTGMINNSIVENTLKRKCENII